MDIERGSLEILFKNIPYDKITVLSLDRRERHDYANINEKLYMNYATNVFEHYSEDESRNNYRYILQEMKNNAEGEPNIFRFIMNVSKQFLTYTAREIKCKFDEMLRWRDISFQLGQDFFTCAFLAAVDLDVGKTTKYFAWLPIIRSDDERLHNILSRGMAENHFHLGGSTKIFELNWTCLMNIIDDRKHDFKKITYALQENHSYSIDHKEEKESFYVKCQKAAFYRIYLFAVIKKDSYIIEKLEELDLLFHKGVHIEEKISDIQDTITLCKVKYGAKVDHQYVLDYALEKDMIDLNNNECRLLTGERRFLYECYKASVTETFNEKQKNMFYQYLSLRTDFRSELIQVNRHVGFANFEKYQDRKEYFIEGKKPYEDELVRLALNASLQKQNIVCIEARICPKNKSSELYKSIHYFNHIAKAKGKSENDRIEKSSGSVKENEKPTKKELENKLIYVLHFPKSATGKFCPASPRNYQVRNRTYLQTKAIVSLLEKGTSLNHCIRGIDACANENSCRPEVFAQYYRYLTNISFTIAQNDNLLIEHAAANLHATYHAGEDFLDIIDGLRAMDEAILFCGLKRGSRIGHVLALGINPFEYYKYKGYKLVLPKQDLLDDIMWLLIKVNEYGCESDRMLYSELEAKFYSLYNEIYGNHIKEANISVLDYYNSWRLRGDYPKNYRLDENDFYVKLDALPELRRISRYEFNTAITNDIRKIEKFRNLYSLYHYNEEVRLVGNQTVDFKVDCHYAEVVHQLQNKMIHKLVLEGIGIETNPSSNYLIGTIQKYEEHPIIRFNSRKLNKEIESNMSLNVSINTDDQGVFDTLLENEYALMTMALKKAKDHNYNNLYDIEDIYEWIDYVRKMGIEQIFQNGVSDNY